MSTGVPKIVVVLMNGVSRHLDLAAQAREQMRKLEI